MESKSSERTTKVDSDSSEGSELDSENTKITPNHRPKVVKLGVNHEPNYKTYVNDIRGGSKVRKKWNTIPK